MANLMRTSNPALNEKAFKGQVAFGEAMTLQGTVNKTGFLLLCVVATAAWTWGLSHSPVPGAAVPWMMGGVFGGFIVAPKSRQGATSIVKCWRSIRIELQRLAQQLNRPGRIRFH